MKKLIIFGLLSAAVTVYALSQSASSTPEMPRVFINTQYSALTGRSIAVPAGGDFQVALNTAQPGDAIILQAGATYAGNFTLKAKGANGVIVIRSGNLANLPPGQRVGPADAPNMARLICANFDPVLRAPSGSPAVEGYRFAGIEITKGASVTNSGALIVLGDTKAVQTTADQAPSGIVFDRCYIHGTPTLDASRGIMANTRSFALIDSYVSEIHGIGRDTQAIAAWNGPGPFKIVNNYLEGAGENVLFGGSDPASPAMVPSDIEFRRNLVSKPLSWKVNDPSYAGIHWQVKNLFETKMGHRILVEGNVFENSWVDAQTGFSILIKSTNQEGTAPFSQTTDVTFRNNVVRHANNAIGVLARESSHEIDPTARVLIANNLLYDIGGLTWGGSGGIFLDPNSGPPADDGSFAGVSDVAVIHNTAICSGKILNFNSYNSTLQKWGACANFTFRDNIVAHNFYGVFGDNGGGVDDPALDSYCPGGTFTSNAIVTAGAMAVRLAEHPGNLLLPTWDNVGFVDKANDNYALAPTSPCKGTASDGQDMGADLGAIDTAQQPSASDIAESQPVASPTPTPSPTSAAPCSAVAEEIVLYARHAIAIVGNWQIVADSSAAEGAALHNPDAGQAKIVKALANPANYFELNFYAAAGVPYHLWIRGRADNNYFGNDSVHIQFSDSLDASGNPIFRIGTTQSTVVALEGCDNQGDAGWMWEDNGWCGLGPDVYFSKTGLHAIRIQQREDGINIDQIVLSPEAYLTASPGAARERFDNPTENAIAARL